MLSTMSSAVTASSVVCETSNLTTSYDPRYNLVWGRMHAHPRPCFTPALLHDLNCWLDAIEARGDLDYLVFGSATPGVFNLGGDLSLFRALIERRDRPGLLRYAQDCIAPLYRNAVHLRQRRLTTITLVQGDALGGGFECALSGTVLVAEKGAKLGFPEILFNLFPGMGALTLLGRRIGLAAAERVVLSGTLYRAEELHAMGAVDVLAEPGEGEQAVYDYVRREGRSRTGILATRAARELAQPVSHRELMGIAEVWVDAALALEGKDLRMMDRLIKRQTERSDSHAGDPALVG